MKVVVEAVRMAYGKSRFYDNGAVAEAGDIAAAPVSLRGNIDRDGKQLLSEIDTLRSINAHLIRQIALLRQREAHAQRLAHRDGLTGLYNQRRMLELLNESMAEAARRDQRVGLLFIDLDGFKGVNDRFGHTVGDELLITVASRIAARARTEDFVCRYGGDEFVVILPRVADMAAVNRVADSIRARVAVPYRLNGIDLTVTAAIGVALYPDEARDAMDLMRRADESMYRAKSRGPELAAAPTRLPAPARRRDDRSKRRRV